MSFWKVSFTMVTTTRIAASASFLLAMGAILISMNVRETASDELMAILFVVAGVGLLGHMLLADRASRTSGRYDERDIQIRYRAGYYSFIILVVLVYVVWGVVVFTDLLSELSIIIAVLVGGLGVNAVLVWGFRQRM